MTTNNVALDHIERLAKENAKLRARLASAEAVIAALPKCEDQGCDGKAVREVCYYGNEFYRHCEKHAPLESYDATYAEPLRAWLAIVGEEATT